jgi:hypothetical protein
MQPTPLSGVLFALLEPAATGARHIASRPFVCRPAETERVSPPPPNSNRVRDSLGRLARNERFDEGSHCARRWEPKNLTR